MPQGNFASNGWAHKQDVVIEINPAKRKKVVAVAAVIALVGIFLMSGEPQRMFKEKRLGVNHGAMVKTMQKLSIDGKVEATKWLVENDQIGSTSRLEELVKQGMPAAMFFLGKQKIADREIVAGKALIEKAAAEGYPDAVQYQMLTK